MGKIDLKDLIKIDCSKDMDYFNTLIKELELFARVNCINLDIKIYDMENNNTRIVIDIPQ